MSPPDFETFADVIREVFHQPQAKITRKSRSTEVPGWNSLSHVMLILELQSAFGTTLEPGDTVTLKDVGALYDKMIETI